MKQDEQEAKAPKKSTRCQLMVKWMANGPAVVARRFNFETNEFDAEEMVVSTEPRDIILQGIADELFAIAEAVDR